MSEETRWVLESAAAIVAAGIPSIAFDIDSLLIRDDGPALLFGPPGSLKSFFAMHVCKCIATGEAVLGEFKVRRRSRAIFVNFDAGPQTTRRRIAHVAPEVENFYVTSPDGFEADALVEVFEQNEGAFIVLDCFSDMYASRRGEDQAETMRRFLRDLRTLYQKYGANGIVIDHPRRAREGEAVGDYYGSVQKEAAIRTMWIATQLHSDVASVGKVKIACKKMSEAEHFPAFVAKITFGPDRIEFDFDGRLDAVTGATIEGPRDAELLERVLRGVAGGMKRSALESRLGWGKDRVFNAIRDSRDVTTIGKARTLRYALKSEALTLESSVAPDDRSHDSSADPKSTENNRAESCDPLKGGRSIPHDSSNDRVGGESSVAPDDRSHDSRNGDRGGDSDGSQSGSIAEPCAFHNGKPGDDCKTCGRSWRDHTAVPRS